MNEKSRVTAKKKFCAHGAHGAYKHMVHSNIYACEVKPEPTMQGGQFVVGPVAISS